MTDAKVLAEALVEAGILEVHTRSITHVRVYRLAGTKQYHSAEGIITDWRVAGKVLESMGGIYAHCESHVKGWHCYLETDGSVRLPVDKATAQHESLPRAIIEAWYAAQEDKP